MPLSLDAAALAGCNLAGVFVELIGSSDWNVAGPRPDGSVSFWWQHLAMIGGGDTPSPSDTPGLRELLRKLEAGELRVEADGGPAEGYAAIPIPPGLWRQKSHARHWWLYREADSGGRLEVLEQGRRVATYYNPRFGQATTAPQRATADTHQSKHRENDKVIARGVEIARGNGGNASKAAKALYAEKYPEPGKNTPEHSAWAEDEVKFVRRTRERIGKALKNASG
jgi:hypothetical protein